MNLSFTRSAWDDYQYWLKTEPLRHQLHGHWSRRISDEHRLVYTVSENTVTVIACRFHY